MDWTILQGGSCGRGACPEWASGLSTAAEQNSQGGWLHPNLWFYANGTEARGQRVLCSWPVGSAPSGIQTTHRSSVAPKTGGFTLVGGVELGHRDLMGCIPTWY